ncbi:PQQ-dependent sugar dehydrogenase [Williamsia maris]|uniref:Glucose/arabinose dehydrogenase, beta-propeller fold n=1 Tax=Williamsia maris TaxID=72806 RepID=A0ABT1HHK5_9NOCA|nr:PQQ-dependent sugar dehydrogenase [Williamsia maris]MCP2177206.1 Glucose/arabinose dehydrogenase, beta-propeller fold [Williamsia maris]
MFDAARRFRVTAVALVATSFMLVGAGCADFGDEDRARSAGEFSPNSQTPVIPTPTPPSSPSNGPEGPPPTGPCVDPDPAVIATCLGATSAVTAGDAQGESTVVAERTTGQIISTRRNGPRRVVATVPVDADSDGGLMDFAPSPTFEQDQLIYAYISTASDNRVVRIAPGDTPKPILTGIPKGATGNVGSIHFKSPTELIVATGDAGDPAAAANPSSLAGKLLSVTALNSGSTAPPRVLASGLGANAVICSDAADGSLYVTDRAPTEDRLQIIDTTGTLRPLWTWPDRPGISGCAAANGSVLISTARTQRVEMLSAPTRERPTVEPPVVVMEKRYGAFGRMAASASGVFQVGTINKQAGRPVPTDDRVVRFMPPNASQSRL